MGETGSFSELVFASNSEDNPLPVELVGFDATPEEEKVQLTWETASETNNSGFAVQYTSPAANGWTELGFVESAAAGETTTEVQSYRFTTEDLSPPACGRALLPRFLERNPSVAPSLNTFQHLTHLIHAPLHRTVEFPSRLAEPFR